MNRPKHNRWLLTLFLVCAIILSLPRPKANAQNFVNNRFNVVVVLDANIRFDSRVQGVSRRSAPRGGHRPAQPRRR